MTSAEFARQIDEAKDPYEPDGWWSGKCPAHDDDNPSLSWKDGTAKILIKCFAECTREAILATMRLTEADTWLRPRGGDPGDEARNEARSETRSGAPGELVAAYNYRDEAGVLLFQVARYRTPDGKKTFRQRRPDPKTDGWWINNLGATRRVLYNLDKIQGQRRVVIVEGEKDADRLALTGLAATTNPMGAGKWSDQYAQQLVKAGVAHATVIPDNDEPGWAHADRVRASCLAAGLIVTVVRLPGVPPGGDVSDYLDRNTVGDLFALLFTPGERRSVYLSDRAEIAFGAALAPLEATLEGGDLKAIARAIRSIDPKQIEPFTLQMLLDALAEPPRPYGGEEDEARERPDVELSGDPYEDMRAMWRVLIAANDPPTVFMYGSALFKMQKSAEMVVLDVDRFRERLIALARFVEATKDGPAPVKPEVDLLKMMLVSDENLGRMPKLIRIVRTPVFAADGRLVQAPGYDAASGVYLKLADGLVVPPVSEAPSEEEVDRARGLLLDDVLVDFPFTGQADKAAVVALALLPFARDLIDGATPLHLIQAPTPGTGKSLLLEVVTTIALGRGVGSMTEADNEEETRKRITAKLIQEPAYVVFENLNKMLRGGSIAQALTASTWEDRILGVSKMVSLPVRCCWVAVANDPSFSPEVSDRIVTCRIVSMEERPRDRDPKQFKHPELVQWVRQRRGELVWACLTLVQNWIARGRGPGDAVLGSFQTWAETMSGILEAAGVTGLLKNRQVMLERADPIGDSRKAFVEMWYVAFKLDTKSPTGLAPSASAAGLDVDSEKKNKDGSLAQSERSRMGSILKKLIDQVFVMPDGVSVTVAPGDPPRDMYGARYRLLVVKEKAESAPDDEYLTGAR